VANNYRQFSAALDIDLSEKEWCQNRLNELQRTPQNDQFSGDSTLSGVEDLDRYESRADFSYKFENQGHGEYIWFYAEEGGNVEHIADFVQEYLAQFHPDKYWSMSWSDTCDRLRLDEFSGGAVFVTAIESKYIDAQNWIFGMVEDFKATQEDSFQCIDPACPSAGAYHDHPKEG